MIQSIDEITTDDLFHALGDFNFIKKLLTAAERRTEHYHGWTKTNSRFGVKVKAFVSLKSALIKIAGILT